MIQCTVYKTLMTEMLAKVSQIACVLIEMNDSMIGMGGSFSMQLMPIIVCLFESLGHLYRCTHVNGKCH